MKIGSILLPALLLTSAVLLRSPVQAQEEPAPQEEAPKPKPKKKAKSQGYDYDKSKYKAYRIDPEPSVYRFDANGKPILPQPKKSPAKKKPVTAPEEPDCQTEEACQDPGQS